MLVIGYHNLVLRFGNMLLRSILEKKRVFPDLRLHRLILLLQFNVRNRLKSKCKFLLANAIRAFSKAKITMTGGELRGSVVQKGSSEIIIGENVRQTA